MKNRLLQKNEEQEVFTDLLFNALLGFAFMFAIAFMLINSSDDSGKIESKAEVMISVSWPDSHPDDVDTIVEDPQGGLVWYHNRDSGLMHLDRDDRGLLNDTIMVNGEEIQNPLNQEVVTLRAVVPGEYIVNIHYYATKTNQPIDVNVKVEKVNPQLEVIYYGTINLEKKGVEKTATRFNITQDGIVNVTGNLFKKLVPES